MVLSFFYLFLFFPFPSFFFLLSSSSYELIDCAVGVVGATRSGTARRRHHHGQRVNPIWSDPSRAGRQRVHDQSGRLEIGV